MAGRNLFKEIFNNFVNSFKFLKSWGELKGKDHFGTEYYEGPVNSHTRKPRRWFIPINIYETKHEMPPEWDAWLRHKRKNPPTEEEIQSNIKKMRSVIENAKRLAKERNVTDKATSTASSIKFPVHEDYINDPLNEQEKKIN